jgi:2-oxoisovalerate dehydrogenase E2 component (dihydrolipoyl transacylase)
MSITHIKMPDIGEGVTQAEIVEWNVAVGDLVREDDVLAAVMTDKATIEIPAPSDGTIDSLNGGPGDIVAVGSVIVTLQTAESGSSDQPVEPTPANQEIEPKPSLTTASPSKKTQTPDRESITVSPAVRKLALDSGAILAHVPATGRDGRVTKGDLLTFLEKSPSPPFKEIKVIGLRRVISQRMQDVSSRIAHFTYVEEIDVTELENLRKHLNDTDRSQRQKLTLLPFLTTAMVQALSAFPNLNAHYDDDAGILRQYSAAHIGIATQTEKGLTVPVLHHAENSDIWQMAAEIKRLAEAARGGTASREELRGSTITLSSLGQMGGVVATPVINSPEVAIIGVNRIRTTPVWRDGGVVPRQMMNLSSSFDHRVIDGYDAANFIQAIKSQLEYPATLFISPSNN